MVTSTGKSVTHADLLSHLLQAVKLPRTLAVCKCAAHASGTDGVSLGNAFADTIAKEAAEGQCHVLTVDNSTILDDTVLKEMQQQAPQNERELWGKHGAKLVDDIYL